MSSSNGVKASDRPESKVCNVSECSAWKTGDLDFCHHHKGMASNGSVENNNNAQSHGLHTSAEVFFEHADQHHLDTYYAVHEALCARFEQAHGREPMHHDKKELAQVALSMAKLDMADEYAAEHAVEPDKPLTEKEPQLTSEGVFKKEVLSKIETLKTDIRRENRLLLKDKGIYDSPEKEAGQGLQDFAEVWEKGLSEQS